MTAVDDAVDEDDESVTLGFGALPAGVMAGSPSTAVLTLADDDTAGVTVSESSLVIDEGRATYTMVLDSQPTASVTVAVTVPAGTDVSVNQPSLTFTALDWSQAQTIEVSAAANDDALGDPDPHVRGGDYTDVEVTIVENDAVGLGRACG